MVIFQSINQFVRGFDFKSGKFKLGKQFNISVQIYSIMLTQFSVMLTKLPLILIPPFVIYSPTVYYMARRKLGSGKWMDSERNDTFLVADSFPAGLSQINLRYYTKLFFFKKSNLKDDSSTVCIIFLLMFKKCINLHQNAVTYHA